MPGHIDGIGLAHVVRAEFPPTRVVLMSSSAPDRATRDSVDGYFQKPFGLAEIREHVRPLLLTYIRHCLFSPVAHLPRHSHRVAQLPTRLRRILQPPLLRPQPRP